MKIRREKRRTIIFLLMFFFVREADKLKKTFLDDCALMLVETVGKDEKSILLLLPVWVEKCVYYVSLIMNLTNFKKEEKRKHFVNI
jgi:hypothetical protein